MGTFDQPGGREAETARDDLAKIPEILRNLNVALREVRNENDEIRARKIIPWIDEQIDTARKLGASSRQIRQLEKAKDGFRDFLGGSSDSLNETSRESLRNLHAEIIQEILTKLNVAQSEVHRDGDYERAGRIVIFIDEQVEAINALDEGDYSARLADLRAHRDRFYNFYRQRPGQAGGQTELLPLESYFDLTREEYRRISTYEEFKFDSSPDSIKARTMEGRQNDHIELLADILRGESGRLNILYGALFRGRPSPLFVDIGPAVANLDYPAITAREMADAFPAMQVFALDLPEEVEKFNRKVSARKREDLLSRRNFTIVAGDGLRSLKEQIPELSGSSGGPVIIRAANSIDIYIKWDEIQPTLARMAEDFKDRPVLLLFNREIMLKEAGSRQWRSIGMVSERGFRHRTRDLRRAGDAYNLKPQYISQSFPQPLSQRLNEQTTNVPEFLVPAIERLREFGLREDGQGIVVDGPTQKLYLVKGGGEVIRTYPVSTGKNGFSTRDGSKATAPGMHVIYRKRGDGLPSGATMGGGRVDIYTDPQKPPAHARVITRAMYLSGKEGQGTEERSIAIHGTNHEGSVLYPEERDGILKGQSGGCIRMLNDDVVDLFDRVDENTLVEIEPRNA